MVRPRGGLVVPHRPCLLGSSLAVSRDFTSPVPGPSRGLLMSMVPSFDVLRRRSSIPCSHPHPKPLIVPTHFFSRFFSRIQFGTFLVSKFDDDAAA